MSNNHSTKENRLSQAEGLPRTIPTVVLYQLDMLLEQATKMMGNSQTPDILKPVYWDAILILRRTGMHFEDLIHLREPDNQGCNGCLEQDSGGYWWLHVHRKINKVDKIYRIPLERHHRVVEAIYRQQERVQGIPDYNNERYLFRSQRGILKYASFRDALARDLAPYLIYDGQSYAIKPLQFRHTLATEMLQQGVDMSVVKAVLGYASLREMDRYVDYQIRNQLFNVFKTLRAQDWGFCTTGYSPDSMPCPHRFLLPHHFDSSDAQRATKYYLHTNGDIVKNAFFIAIETLRKSPHSQSASQEQILELQDTEQTNETTQQESDKDGPLGNC